MSDVAVLVPLRIGGCRHRQAAWGYVRQWWAMHHPDWRVVTGDCGDGPWSKGASVSAALAETAAEVLVVADADVWCDGVGNAVAEVYDGVAWAIPHRRVYRLNETATRRVLAGGRPVAQTDALMRKPYVGVAGGGLVVTSRRVLADTPMDPRFRGWGQEDSAWALALETLHGACRRGDSALWHLYHPPAPRISAAAGSPQSYALHQRYQRASGKPQEMRQLISRTDDPPDPVSEARGQVRFTNNKHPQLQVYKQREDGTVARLRFRDGRAQTSDPLLIDYLRSLGHLGVVAVGEPEPATEPAANGTKPAAGDTGAAVEQSAGAVVTEDPDGQEPDGQESGTDESPTGDGDGDGPAELASQPNGVPDAGAREILAWVGDDPQRAQQALEVEQARDKPRSTLAAALTKLAD